MEQGYKSLPIVGVNGDSWSTPASTLESCWAALGAGAHGLMLSAYITKDSQLVCTPSASVKDGDGNELAVSDLEFKQLQLIDAGLHYRSTVLDADAQPTGRIGNDTPWKALEQKRPLKTRKAITYQTIEYLLQYFARRTSVSLLLDPSVFNKTEYVDLVLNYLAHAGLLRRVSLVSTIDVLTTCRARMNSAVLILHASEEPVSVALINRAEAIKVNCILTSYNAMYELSDEQRAQLLALAQKSGIGWSITTPDMPFAPTQAAVNFLEGIKQHIHSVLVHGVLPAINAVNPAGVVLNEKFKGPAFDEKQWRVGFSSLYKDKSTFGKPDCKIELNDGLEITLIEGVRYSGGAAATVIPIHGDFDVSVDFHVASPAQATTFELAAIGIDPGYHTVDMKDVTTRNANLTFDVHGAPPYASSERDQNDGFRSGWNNSYNLTQVSEDWESRSVNMYNKYTRDVGDGSADNLFGSLRLTRSGSVFNSYYKDKYNATWVGSGSMLVQSMPSDCFIRLALKHWGKAGKPPPNKVVFTNFLLRQR